MKFEIVNNVPLNDKRLLYYESECSFYMEPFDPHYDLELAVNTITLSVVNNEVVQVSGFCGISSSIVINCEVPKIFVGALLVEHGLEHGFIYDIFDSTQQVYRNLETGWVCLGDYRKNGLAVEFIRNCVAVISSEGEMMSLWLNPKILTT